MRENQGAPEVHDGVVSIIGPGMRVIGDCVTEGTLRVDGVVEGAIRAGKAVVIGKDSLVIGDITTQDAVIGGKVQGKIMAGSRLELQATCIVEGEVFARRIKLEEGGQVFGTVQMGESVAEVAERESAGREAEEEPVPAGD